MTAVPPIHVINLDRSAERLRRFLDLNAHLGDVNRFRAIDGAALDREALIASGHIGEDLVYGPGTLGCALSHVGLWERAAAEYRCFTIMEDDAVTTRRFHARAEAVLEDLDEWDFIFWGWNLNPAFAWVDLGVTKVRLEGYGPARYDSVEALESFQAVDEGPSAVKMLHAFGSHAYSVSPRGARSALEYCLPLRSRLIDFPDAGVSAWNTSLDVDLCGLLPQANAFLCVPPLAIQYPCQSVRLAIDQDFQEIR